MLCFFCILNFCFPLSKPSTNYKTNCFGSTEQCILVPLQLCGTLIGKNSRVFHIDTKIQDADPLDGYSQKPLYGYYSLYLIRWHLRYLRFIGHNFTSNGLNCRQDNTSFVPSTGYNNENIYRIETLQPGRPLNYCPVELSDPHSRRITTVLFSDLVSW